MKYIYINSNEKIEEIKVGPEKLKEFKKMDDGVYVKNRGGQTAWLFSVPLTAAAKPLYNHFKRIAA